MMNKEQLETITKELFRVQDEYQGSQGRKNRESVIYMGSLLSEINRELTKQRTWEKWCYQFKNRISITTIKRYIRVYNRSLLTDPTKLKTMSIEDLYIEEGIIKTDKEDDDAGDNKPNPGNPQPPQPKQTRFEYYQSLLQRLSDIAHYQGSNDENTELFRLGGPYREWCRGLERLDEAA